MDHLRADVLRVFALALPLLGVGSTFRGGLGTSPPNATEHYLLSTADSAHGQDSLRVWLELPSEVTSGMLVPLTLRIENTGTRPIELYLRGRTITFDVHVWNSDGELVWHRLAGEIIPAIIALTVLAPGERLEARAQWDQRMNDGDAVPPGQYRARGSLLTDASAPLETSTVPLRIAPR